MALLARDDQEHKRKRATVSDVRSGAYLASKKRLWYVIAYIEEEGEAIIEDCADPLKPKLWAPVRFLSINGPVDVVRPPRAPTPAKRDLAVA